MGNLKYALIQRRNPQKKDAPQLFYATAQKSGDLTFEEIKQDISERTTATAGDVSLVIESLLLNIAKGLKEGKSVFLDKFGKFRLSLSSKGVSSMKEFSTDLIRSIRIVFTPCKELRFKKKDLAYEQTVSKVEQKKALKAQMNGGSTAGGGTTGGSTGGNTTGGGSTTGGDNTGGGGTTGGDNTKPGGGL